MKVSFISVQKDFPDFSAVYGYQTLLVNRDTGKPVYYFPEAGFIGRLFCCYKHIVILIDMNPVGLVILFVTRLECHYPACGPSVVSCGNDAVPGEYGLYVFGQILVVVVCYYGSQALLEIVLYVWGGSVYKTVYPFIYHVIVAFRNITVGLDSGLFPS